MKFKLNLLTGAVALAALSTGAGVALAQDAPQASSGMDDIVVTARKREESLQSIPVAISAFSGESLEERGVDNAADLGNIVPSLSTASNNQSSSSGVS
ncbi:MAG: TonB-dependent receptor, partial [Caulobacterales bacterium]